MRRDAALGCSCAWLCLAGKTSIVRCLAALCGQLLVEVALTAGTDTSDILGGFEQLEPRRRIQARPAPMPSPKKGVLCISCNCCSSLLQLKDSIKATARSLTGFPAVQWPI